MMGETANPNSWELMDHSALLKIFYVKVIFNINKS